MTVRQTIVPRGMSPEGENQFVDRNIIRAGIACGAIE
jgi:hypothetical protein